MLYLKKPPVSACKPHDVVGNMAFALLEALLEYHELRTCLRLG